MDRNGIPQVDLDADLGSADELLHHLDEHGLVRFTAPADESCLLRLAQRIGPVYQHRDADANGITRVRAVSQAASERGKGGLTRQGLGFHTDSSGAEAPPSGVLLYCLTPADSGGESVLVSAQDAHDDLGAAVCDSLCRADAAVFGSGTEWYRGPVFSHDRFSHDDAGRVRVRFRYDQDAFFSIGAWEHIDAVLRSFEKRAVSFRLDSAEGYVIANDRWLHGRTPFTGSRELWRILIR